ncbi:hypothetical protein GGF46_005409 [Coemansia sp. RSA 552]|nr:hypothetical protein GGF46_005409 [Coemansia sp. RSA 552]
MPEDKAPLPETPGAGVVGFDLNSSVLLGTHASPARSDRKSAMPSRFDPVAQLMASDDSDSESEAVSKVTHAAFPPPPQPVLESQDLGAQPEKERTERRKRMDASRFVLSKPRANTIVGRLARSRRVVDSDSSSSEDEGGQDEAPPPSPKPKTEPLFEGDTDAKDTEKVARKATKERAASKAALARMHQESERLVRETQVKVDPEEFTRRLALSDFFERFDAHVQAAGSGKGGHRAGTSRRPIVVPPVQIRGSFTFVDDETDEMVVIDADSDRPRPQKQQHKDPVLLQPTQRAVKSVHENTLNAILSYGSQPLHVSSQGTGRRTDGPLALRDLNSALLGVMYKKDVEAKAASIEKKREAQRRRQEREAAGSQAVGEQDIDEPQANASEPEDENDDEDEEEADEDAEVESVAGMDEDVDSDRPAAAHRRGARRVVESSDEDDESGDEPQLPAAPAATKAKFLGMFRMPAARAAVPPDLTQPTQPMDSLTATQLTPLTVPTASTDDNILPSMVRRALDTSNAEPEAASGGSDSNEMADVQALLPEPRRHRRIRRHPAAKEATRPKGKRVARSEFVEAEAEEGESSESGDEARVVARRKFNWGGDEKLDASDDEDDYDMDPDEEEAALMADPMIDNEVVEDSEADDAVRALHRRQDFVQDEKDIHELFHDVTTGGLRNRNSSRTAAGFALGEGEDYNDRQTRAERMEERLRLRRKLLAREIHDQNLAEIAKNPETAAFAHAALMRVPQSAADSDAEDVVRADDLHALEEEIDDHSIATAVRAHLARGPKRRIDSEAESDSEDAAGSRELSASASISADDGDPFGAISVEKLIVRRRTLHASGQGPAQGRPPLKRPAGSVVMPAAASAKRANTGS